MKNGRTRVIELLTRPRTPAVCAAPGRDVGVASQTRSEPCVPVRQTRRDSDNSANKCPNGDLLVRFSSEAHHAGSPVVVLATARIAKAAGPNAVSDALSLRVILGPVLCAAKGRETNLGVVSPFATGSVECHAGDGPDIPISTCCRCTEVVS
jgi:hypothetical protein